MHTYMPLRQKKYYYYFFCHWLHLEDNGMQQSGNPATAKNSTHGKTGSLSVTCS